MKLRWKTIKRTTIKTIIDFRASDFGNSKSALKFDILSLNIEGDKFVKREPMKMIALIRFNLQRDFQSR